MSTLLSPLLDKLFTPAACKLFIISWAQKHPINILMEDTFFKLRILQDVLSATQKERESLLNELIDNATDPVIKKRRYRMLSNLATFEACVIKKIYEFETDDASDLYSSDIFVGELSLLLDRSA